MAAGGLAAEPGKSAMPACVVDTDVVSFWLKEDTRGGEYARALHRLTLIVSFQTIAELLRWPLERNWGDARRAELDVYLGQFAVVPSSLQLA